MSRLLQPLWLLLALATDRELARMVKYLKAENRILRDKLPPRLTVTPRTFARWAARAEPGSPPRPAGARKPVRPRTAEDIRELILRLARENGWGGIRACSVS